MAIAGSVVISLGLVLQKRGVGWFRHKDKTSAEYKHLKQVWFLGFALNNLLSVFYYFALKGLSASVVGAMMGLNIIFSALFSGIILKEHVSKTVITLSAFLVCSIVLANFSSPLEAAVPVPAALEIFIFFLVPYALAALAQLFWRLKMIPAELYAICFAGTAGALEGFIIILIKALQVSRGDNPLRYLTSVYLYLYIIASISLISFMQVAYAHGRMTRTEIGRASCRERG